MNDYLGGLPFSTEDIRHQVRTFRKLGMPRQEALDTVVPPRPAERRPGSLTSVEVKRIFDEEWPEP
jgi:hypothetical protein